MSRAVLAADIHLSAADPATAEAFLGALRAVTAGARRLFLLGDLFDAWIGDDVDAEPSGDAESSGSARPLGDARPTARGAASGRGGTTATAAATANVNVDATEAAAAAADQDALARRVAAALRAVAAGGTAVALGRGNRDFLIGQRYAAACGAALLPEPAVVVPLAGEPTLLTHGDELCTGDVDYQRLRSQLRSPAWQAAFLAQPRAVRLAAAQRLRGQSESAKRGKADAIMDVDPDAVAAAMRAHGVRAMVHGHTHRPAVHAFELDGMPAVRRVLTDWDAAARRGGFLVADDQGWQVVDAFGSADPA